MAIKIKGLIRLYNQVRDLLPQADRESALLIELQVKENLKEIEAALERNDCVPESLPEPSRQAYYYLKKLDFSCTKQKLISPPTKKIRIKNLIKTYQLIMNKISISSSLFPLEEELKQVVKDLWSICNESKASPLDLPTPSLKAFASLYFLSLANHLEEAITLKEILLQQSQHWQNPLKTILFNNGRFLWQYTPKKSLLVLNEGYLGIGSEQIAWLSKGLNLNNQNALTQLKAFADGENFYEPLLELEVVCGSQVTSTGVVYNLEELFYKLNDQYFEGDLAKPRLQFNKTLNTRKLGQYSATHDTILISSILDQEQVPEFAIGLVVYHEMLHKFLGIEYRDGRRIMHPPKFRKLEREYKNYQEAENWLNQWAAML